MVQEGYEALVQVEELEEEFMGLEGVFHVAEHHKLAFCIFRRSLNEKTLNFLKA